MEYIKGNIGRIYVARFDHGDDIHKGVEKIAKAENIKCANISFLGALAEANIVAGPKVDELPPEPNAFSFDAVHEVVGFGVITNDGENVHAHIHISAGRGKEVIAGCLRKDPKVFITIEAVITEVAGVSPVRKESKETGIRTLRFE